MKNWKIPVASVQKFAPNEYISACEPMLLNCDLCADVVGEGKKYDRVHVDGFMEGGIMDGQYAHKTFTSCGAESMEVECGELSKLTVTAFGHYSEVAGAEVCGNHWVIPMSQPVEAYFWMTDNIGHATAATFELNKS